MKDYGLLEILNKIDGIEIEEVMLGSNLENHITIKILDEKDYGKWDHFSEQVYFWGYARTKVKRDYPHLTFIFHPDTRPDPFLREEGALEDTLTQLEVCTWDFKIPLSEQAYKVPGTRKGHLNAFLKGTNQCNLDCKYCYDKPYRNLVGHNKILPMDKVDRFYKLMSDYAEEISMDFHGGEPTLCGVKYYTEIMENIIPKYQYSTFDINMQTNGTLLDEKWFDFYKKYGVTLGTSYNALNDHLRLADSNNKLGNSKNTPEKVLSNMRSAVKNHVDIGNIDVLTSENHPKVKELYEFYKKESIPVTFLLAFEQGDAKDSTLTFNNEEKIKEFLDVSTDYFEYWAKDKDHPMTDRYASWIIQCLLTGNGASCDNVCNCLNKTICITSNGDLYHCDRCLFDKYRLGNIDEFETLKDVYNTPKYRNFVREREEKLEKYCNECDIYPYCHGRCPMTDIGVNGTAALPNEYECKTMKLNLLAGFRALSRINSIDECNGFLRNYLIMNGGILPKEIPIFLKSLGIDKKLGDYNFDSESLTLEGNEFKLFRMFNEPSYEKRLVPVSIEQISEINPNHNPCDDRMERLTDEMRTRAENIKEELNSEVC